ncbi:MAG: polysaccharide biosynthesis protein [Bacilli bacterium]|nr:polysaccharide biosynthesis protein [Bacilli bacterium]
MKKDLTMKKSTFVTGAFITTLGIVISKILGILYVIPFHAIIGETGGALYGYAYTIYLLFMSLSSAGIPLAISRIVSEYQALGYYNTKKRVFILGKRIALVLGIICFLIITIFAPSLAKAVLGNVTGGNSLEDVTLVIRVIGTAILVVPVLSVYRGYFEGHRFMSAPSISQVLEQIVRVLIIIFGSLMAIKTFNLDLTTAVGVALFGATAGALVAYLYLVYKKLKNNRKFNERIRPVNEPIVTDKAIIRKIVYYAIPFIMIDVFKTAYNYIDMTTVVKGLVNSVHYSAVDAETIYSMLSTWANKFNMIVLAISTGVIVSLIPNVTESVVKKQEKEVNNKVNQALSVLLFLTIPMTLGISFLSKAIWTLFYGDSVFGPSVLSYYIFLGLIIGLFTCVITIIQVLKDYKVVFISLISGVLLKLLLNHNLLIAFSNMNLPPYYGFITASILGYLLSFVICMVVLQKKYKIKFEYLVKNLVDITCGSLIMILLLSVIKFVIPVYSTFRLNNLVIILVYAVIGAIIYFVYAYFTGLTKKVFGKDIIMVLKRVLTKK